ncbi:hypothetical protein [Marinobacter sp.]|uniref:hypothetical protein n=1 Tax=Marinobacter sp. TaxID=50741 RepID=UPI003BADAD33
MAAFPNSGFMGMPLLIALIGPIAAGPLLISIVIDTIITSSLCIALASRSAESSGGLYRSVKSALQKGGGQSTTLGHIAGWCGIGNPVFATRPVDGYR